MIWGGILLQNVAEHFSNGSGIFPSFRGGANFTSPAGRNKPNYEHNLIQAYVSIVMSCELMSFVFMEMSLAHDFHKMCAKGASYVNEGGQLCVLK